MYAMQELDELSALVCAAGQQAQAGAASLAAASNQVASLYYYCLHLPRSGRRRRVKRRRAQVLLGAPIQARLAEWLRLQPSKLATGVRFSHLAPFRRRGSLNGKAPGPNP